MKKVKILSALLIAILVMQISFVYAAKDPVKITSVSITGIDYPYSTGSILDTTAEVSNSSNSIVSEVSWSKTSDNLHKVIILLRPNINYEYVENATATVNGNKANNVFVNEDGYLEVSYVFEKDDNISLPNSSATLTHAINVLYTRHGTISPNPIRAPHNKNFTVQIIPDEGYEVEDVIVDGDSVGAVTEYTFRRVTENHKIKAYFKKIEEDSSNIDEEIEEVKKVNLTMYNFIIDLFKVII